MKTIPEMLLRTNKEIRAFLAKAVTEPEINDYVNKVYKQLLSIQPGQTFEYKKHMQPENMEMFIHSVCAFMAERPNDYYVFSNDFETIIRR